MHAYTGLSPIIKRWAGQFLITIDYSGSNAKGTAVRGGTDVDLFISLAPTTPDGLRQVHETLREQLRTSGYTSRSQNVSVRLSFDGISVDLVPGKKQAWLGNDHSLYCSKTDTWRQTDIKKQIAHVKNSWRVNEIRALKIWRNLHGLDFPSFYLELIVIQALGQRPIAHLADNIWQALRFIAEDFPDARVEDPANTNNIISDDLTIAEKNAIASQASSSLMKSNWSQIIW